MANHSKTFDKVIRGDSDSNIRFSDLCSLLDFLGFEQRVRGSHHILTHEDVIEILNIQPQGSKAKPYQVRQVRRILTGHGFARMFTMNEPTATPEDTIQPEENEDA